jgi:hypothetical protein
VYDGPAWKATRTVRRRGRAAKALAVAGYHSAGERHSWTTLSIDAGVPHDQIHHDGGWADARLVSYYTHGRDQALRATTHSVAAYVLSAA